MKNIDYDAYLATIQDLATNQKDKIKKYLEEQCEKDEALKSLYRPTHIDGCYNFILECVRKSSNGNAVVEDAIVFKMARDYFIEILPKVAEDAPEIKPTEVEQVQETVTEVAEQIEEDAAADEEPEEEKLEIEAVEQEKQPEEIPADPEQSEEVQYDEEGQGMLFSF